MHEVCLINLPVPQLEDDRRQPPGGLLALAGYVHQKGHTVALVDLAGQPREEWLPQIPQARVYGISTYTVTFAAACHLVRQLRARSPEAFFVAGGPHASALPQEVSRDFDCAVVGEGEEALHAILDLIAQGQAQAIPPVIRATPIAHLDDLPWPDPYAFTDLRSYSRSLEGEPVVCLNSSRGCPYRCRFCNSRVAERGSWRPRSPQSVVDEVCWHLAHGFRAFRFDDDAFTTDRDRCLQICRLLQPLGVKFRIFSRADALDPPLCAALAQAGCRHIALGIESFSPRMLALMGKATSVAKISAGLRTAHDAGMRTRGYFITGFPGETDATVAESLEMLPKVSLDEAVVYPCIPYPGTDLFASPAHYGITWIDPDYSQFIQVGVGRSAGFVMATHSFGPDQVRCWHQQYMRSFSELGISWSDERKVAV